MSEIVERLRFKHVHLHNPMALCAEAADEITRLETRVKGLERALWDMATGRVIQVPHVQAIARAALNRFEERA